MPAWNQFGGDRRNGGHRPELPDLERPTEAWHVDLPDAPTTHPVLDRDRVFVGAAGRLLALERPTGRRRWVAETDGTPRTPVATAEAVYLADAAGTVSAREPRTGEEGWTTALEGPLESPLALAEGLLLVGGASGMTALEADSGEQRWHQDTASSIRGCPAIANDRLFVGTGDGAVRALALETGEEIWAAPTDGTLVGGPTAIDDRVYVADDAGTLLSLAVDTGQSWFAYQSGDAFASAPTVVGDAAFVAGADEHCHVVETTFGKRKLRGLLFSKKGLSLDAPVRGGPVVAGDVCCLGDANGTLYGIAVDDERLGDFLWHAPSTGVLAAPPALAAGELYAAFEDRVARLSTSST